MLLTEVVICLRAAPLTFTITTELNESLLGNFFPYLSPAVGYGPLC